MIRIYLFFTLFFLSLSGLVVAQSGSGELRGKITDNNKAEVPFANIIVELNGSQVAFAQSDFEGNFSVKPIAPGRYDVRVKILGYNEWFQKGVLVVSNKTTPLDPKLSPSVKEIKTIDVSTYRVPVIEIDQTVTGGTITSEEIKNAPTRNINSLVSQTAGVYQQDEGDALNIQGSRSDANEYYIDGVKVRGQSNIPQSGIEQISVITGGLPAQYGDATGGVISITTKGPSREYNGGIEVGTSEFLDGFGYNLGAFNLSGPLYLKDKGTETERSLLGFFVSGEVESRRDQDPTSVQLYKIKEDRLQYIRENPLRTDASGGLVREAEFTTLADMEKIKAKQDNEALNVALSSKVDFQPVAGTTITLGASGTNNKRRLYDDRQSLFNSERMNQEIRNSYRVYTRLTQKFGQGGEGNTSLLKNSYYSIQLDYSKDDIVQQDIQHEDNFFDYGYIGKFDILREQNPLAATSIVRSAGDTVKFVQSGMFKDTMVTFEAGDQNPLRAFYTQQYIEKQGNPATIAELQNGRGLANGDNTENVYGGLFFGPGFQFNVPNGGQYNHIDRNQYRLAASASSDLKNHAILFGIEYEQRIESQYSASPLGVWSLMRGGGGLANKHIQLNTADSIFSATGDTVYFNRMAIESQESYFSKSLRKKLGAGETEFIDIDSYDPDVFSLDMFSAEELLDSRIVNTYSGFDYTGNKSSSKVSFLDFFNDTINRPVGAFQPIYMAGYVQDKFTFKDIIFNLGVRVDRFDANQLVLKDKYSLYDVRTKGEVPGSLNKKNGGAHPATIGDDYVVYVEDAFNGTEILGYRSGDLWYDANGNVTDFPDQLKNAKKGEVTPYLSESVKRDPSGRAVLSESSFADFEPKLSVMPRISFSFPISDEAVFFANYDVLTQRARTNVFSNPIAYYRLENGSGTALVSPDLKPEKTINYQFGFKQKLTNASALSITASYRELKDNMQQVQIENAYPQSNYFSFRNVDFGTVKGLTASYDLRRTGNVRLNAAYTLQFADGTGSTSNSANNLLQSGEGNLKIPVPLDYDQRHTIVTTLDYRYASGTEYNGPAWGRGFFEDFGVNFIFRAGSGVPYSRISQDKVQDLLTAGDTRFRTLIGDINGSRLPWQYKLDMRVDKDIALSAADANGRPGNSLNVYLLVQNVFDTKNIIDVYPATGNPDDDGFLTSNQGKDFVSKQTDAQSYMDLYRIRLQDPDKLSLPRIIRLGATYNF